MFLNASGAVDLRRTIFLALDTNTSPIPYSLSDGRIAVFVYDIGLLVSDESYPAIDTELIIEDATEGIHIIASAASQKSRGNNITKPVHASAFAVCATRPTLLGHLARQSMKT